MALAYAVAVIAVVGGLIFGVTQFRSAVTHSTELAAQEVNAQAAAEAGYAAAVAELQADAGWRTHDAATLANAEALAKDPQAVPKLAFGKALPFETCVAGKLTGLDRVDGGPGDYTFQVGRGLGPTVGRGFDGTFRVKVAPVVLPGYQRPLIAVESRGRFDQRAIAIVALLEAGGTTTAPASLLHEYLLADGEVLDPALGEDTVLAQGALYGGQGVQLAGVRLDGVTGIHSGAGVWLADPGDVTFAGGVKLSAPGGDRPDPNHPSSDLFDASAGRVVDHRHGGKLALPDVGGMDRPVAGAVDLGLIVATGAPDDADHYEGGSFIRKISTFTNPYGPPGETIELCFGRPGNDDPVTYPRTDGTAVLFAKGANLVVWGSPDRDVVIYTDRDLYVAGDFNHGASKSAQLVARSRIWLDSRHPSRSLANELVPWVAQHLAGADAAPPRIAKDVLFLDPASSDPVIKEAAGRAIGVITADLTAPSKIPAVAEKLVYRVLAPLEKRTQAGGIHRMAQAYHDALTPNLPPPEQTVNAQLVDAATRLGDWDRGKKGKKPLPEIGGTYLREGQLIQRVQGSEIHLRQLPPDPQLAITADVNVGNAPARKRVFARWQGRSGLANVFRMVCRREAVLAAEARGAEQSLANWP